MLISACKEKEVQPIISVGRPAVVFAGGLGLLLLLLGILFLPAAAWAQSQAEHVQTTSPETLIPADTAPVVVSGKVRFHVVGISAYPAKRRAEETAHEIEKLAQNPRFDPGKLRIEDAGDYHKILAGESVKPILLVLEADARSEGVLRAVLAQTLLISIAESIEDYRQDRKPAVLTQRLFYALGSLAVLIALLLAVFLGFRLFDRYMERLVKVRTQELEEKSKRVFRREQFWRILHSVLQMLRTLVVVILIYIFFIYSLGLFPQTRYTADRMSQFVLASLGDVAEAVINFIPALVFLVFVYFITRSSLKIVRSMFRAIENRHLQIKGFEVEWTWPTYRLIRVVIIIIALVIAYPYIPGSQSAAFKGVSVLLGVLLSLGSTSVISNVMAGYTMTYRRAFRIGDRVRIGDVFGDVTEMRVLVTHLRTPKNEEVVIPNSTILNSEVINYSTMARGKGLILHTTVGIGYEVPWRQVEAMLLLAAQRTEGLLKEPKPFIRQKALADFAVNYELNAYCDDASRMMELYTEMHRNIQDVFNENGVQIMTPAYERDPAEPKVVPRERWHTPLTDETG